jgi:hypothetical protein
MPEAAPTLLYHEQQRFTQPWLWALLLGLAAIQFWAFGQSWLPGHQATSEDPPLWLACSIIGFTAVALPLFMACCRLDVTVRSDTLVLRFVPFHLHPVYIDYRTVQSCLAVKYNPTLDYGGWGLRYGRNGRAYNVSGNLGVQLEFNSGPALLIGSQHPLELADAINAAASRIRQGDLR